MQAIRHFTKDSLCSWWRYLSIFTLWRTYGFFLAITIFAALVPVECLSLVLGATVLPVCCRRAKNLRIFLSTIALFVDAKDGGLGVESMLSRGRRVAIVSVLKWLNRAVLGGCDAVPADELWLEAWREEVEEEGGEDMGGGARIPGASTNRRRRGDLLAACRERLARLGLRIRDARPAAARAPSRRRARDAVLLDMVAAAEGKELGLLAGAADDEGVCAKARARVANALVETRWRCLGELVSDDGQALLSWKMVSTSRGNHQPEWFSVVERVCALEPGRRAGAW